MLEMNVKNFYRFCHQINYMSSTLSYSEFISSDYEFINLNLILWCERFLISYNSLVVKLACTSLNYFVNLTFNEFAQSKDYNKNAVLIFGYIIIKIIDNRSYRFEFK